MIVEKLLNLLFLRSQNNAMPFYDACALAVLGHHIGTLIEHFNETLCFGALESEGGKSSMLLLHL